MLIDSNTNTLKLLVKKADEESTEKSAEKSANKSDNNKNNKKSNTVGNIATNVAAITAGLGAGYLGVGGVGGFLLAKNMQSANNNNLSVVYSKDLNKNIDDLIKLKEAMGYKGTTSINDLVAVPIIRKSKALKDNNIVVSARDPIIKAKSYKGALSSYYLPDTILPTRGNIVRVPLKNKYIAAHEYGHATGSNKLVTSKLPLYYTFFSRKTLPILSTALGAKYDSNKEFKDQDTSTKILAGATGIAAGGAGLTLAEEARASIRGARKLKEIGAGTYRGAIKSQLPAYGTYIFSLGVGPYLGYKVAKKTKEKINEYRNKEDNKDSSEVTTHDIQES